MREGQYSPPAMIAAGNSPWKMSSEGHRWRGRSADRVGADRSSASDRSSRRPATLSPPRTSGGGGSGSESEAAYNGRSSSRELLTGRSFRPIRTAHQTESVVDPRRPIPCVMPAKPATNGPMLNGPSADTSQFDVRLERPSSRLAERRRTGYGYSTFMCRPPIVAATFIVALLSPVAMVTLSAMRPMFVGDGRQRAAALCATVECQSYILSLAVRITLAAFCLIAAFFHCDATGSALCRRRKADGSRTLLSSTTLPRPEMVETGLLGLVVLDVVVFWSIYAVRVAANQDAPHAPQRAVHGDDFTRSVNFAMSMADSLVFVVGLTILATRLGGSTSGCGPSVDDERSADWAAPRYGVHVVQSPSGWSTTLVAGSSSIQRLAVRCVTHVNVQRRSSSDKKRPGWKQSAFCSQH